MSETEHKQTEQAPEVDWSRVTTLPIVPPKPTRRCPKCGNTNMDWGDLMICGGKHNLGPWCLRCLADLLDQHVPRMQPIEQEGT